MEPIKFNQEFIERRLAEHQRWQHQVEYALIEEIIDEVQALPKRTPKTGRLFDLKPENVQFERRLSLRPWHESERKRSQRRRLKGELL